MYTTAAGEPLANTNPATPNITINNFNNVNNIGGFGSGNRGGFGFGRWRFGNGRFGQGGLGGFGRFRRFGGFVGFGSSVTGDINSTNGGTTIINNGGTTVVGNGNNVTSTINNGIGNSIGDLGFVSAPPSPPAPVAPPAPAPTPSPPPAPISITGGFSGTFQGSFFGQFAGSFTNQPVPGPAGPATPPQNEDQLPPDSNTQIFDGVPYVLDSSKAGKGNKLTFRNPSLPSGRRVLDFNPITGAFKTHSPVALDLDGSWKIETTGASTAKHRISSSIGKTVAFDINGDGVKEKIEWMSGQDGLLVDDRDGQAAKSMNGNRLFGDANGQFASGYDKLALLDADVDGALTGSELAGLKVWQDNGDARVQADELESLADLGITHLSTQRQDVLNAAGETLMQSVAKQHGHSILTEDVWFGQA